MERILLMSVREAYEKCNSNSACLAKEIWNFKHPDEELDERNREYVSWFKSIPYIISVMMKAGLGNLDVIFELPTPLGDYIDVSVTGKSRIPKEDEFGRLLIIELKQWSDINKTDNVNYVEISTGNGQTDMRRHPVSQICEYKSHMSNNHYGIYKNGHIEIDTIAYLHNFEDKSLLFNDIYNVWEEYSEKVFIKENEEELIKYLQDSFLDTRSDEVTDIIKDCGYVMDSTGFEGLKSALAGEENATMVKDQMQVVDCVRNHLMNQKINPHQEIILLSGGPGTGKTIVGMHFIYDYAEIFNNRQNADGAVFCLPRSRTVKAMIDYECNAEVVPYLDRINKEQNLVVVDEAHRITGIDRAIDDVFDKGTRLLIMLQDDHQRIRAGEEGTVAIIESYAERKRIPLKKLELSIQKRCESLGMLVSGLEKMFYGVGKYNIDSISSVRVFEKLSVMNEWITHLAETSRAKVVAPYCWEWNGGMDVNIDDDGEIFKISWNPNKPDEQVAWYYGLRMAEKAASIYTCQGLDLDDVAFVWWNDLVWDEVNEKWKANINVSKDKKFKEEISKAGLSDEEITTLFLNTYYVMLSRARNKMGIWFKDEATKRYVKSFLRLEAYDSSDKYFNDKDDRNTVQAVVNDEPNFNMRLGIVSYVESNMKYAYIKSENMSYLVSEKTIKYMKNPRQILVKGNQVSFSVYHGKNRDYANDIKVV